VAALGVGGVSLQCAKWATAHSPLLNSARILGGENEQMWAYAICVRQSLQSLTLRLQRKIHQVDELN